MDGSVVEILRFHDDNLGGMADDVCGSIKRFSGTPRQDEAEALRSLWLHTFEGGLAAWSDARLGTMLARAGAWRVENGLPIFRTPAPPTIAYAVMRRGNELTLVLLGGCCEYPNGSENDWWLNVIGPRAKAL